MRYVYKRIVSIARGLFKQLQKNIVTLFFQCFIGRFGYFHGHLFRLGQHVQTEKRIFTENGQ